MTEVPFTAAVFRAATVRERDAVWGSLLRCGRLSIGLRSVEVRNA